MLDLKMVDHSTYYVVFYLPDHIKTDEQIEKFFEENLKKIFKECKKCKEPKRSCWGEPPEDIETTEELIDYILNTIENRKIETDLVVDNDKNILEVNTCVPTCYLREYEKLTGKESPIKFKVEYLPPEDLEKHVLKGQIIDGC